MNMKTGYSNPAKNLFCYATLWYDLCYTARFIINVPILKPYISATANPK